MTALEAGDVLADPGAYTDVNKLDSSLAVLRRESPVHWVESPNYRPFWGITRHADVMTIERQPELFRNAPRPILVPTRVEEQVTKQRSGFRTLVQMDGRQHKVMRAIGADWFTPRAMRRMETRIQELAKRYVDRMAELGGRCDFVTDVAAHFPLYAILSLLGLPEEDFPRVLHLTREMFGNSDEELARDTDPAKFTEVQRDFFSYFGDLTARRRATPTDDLASVIANARVDGELLSELDTISYYTIIATAGHETTTASLAGGLHALIEHPGELRRLQADPGLLPTAADEMIRWTSPAKGFMRNAVEDYDLRGVTIKAGDAVFLSYVSANRDEEVFDDPFRFDVGRTPNKHLAFGFGVHYCLGAALAKMEIRAFYAELLPRLRSIDLAGTPKPAATTLAGGLKTLPISYTLQSGQQVAR
ncbi:cytochrome P450 [Actinocrispum sp. NPDC049592]|uniref:cytochrome P450 n=1 Tax=Actinocrispum sp. NPDC049592 TaxID=3154835 RepID=UPI00341421D9